VAMIRRADADRQARDAIGLDLGDMARRGEVLREEAIRSAEEILTKAHADRKALMLGAEEEARKAGYAKGMEAGLAEGRELGKAEALSQWAQRIEELAAEWETALREVERAREQVLRTATSDLLTLGAAFAARVARRAVELDPDPVASQLRAVLERAASGSVIAVRVHPDDHEATDAALPSILHRLSKCEATTLIPDASVSPGSCRVELAGGGVIDADLEQQLDRLVRTLMPGGDQDMTQSEQAA